MLEGNFKSPSRLFVSFTAAPERPAEGRRALDSAVGLLAASHRKCNGERGFKIKNKPFKINCGKSQCNEILLVTSWQAAVRRSHSCWTLCIFIIFSQFFFLTSFLLARGRQLALFLPPPPVKRTTSHEPTDSRIQEEAAQNEHISASPQRSSRGWDSGNVNEFCQNKR